MLTYIKNQVNWIRVFVDKKYSVTLFEVSFRHSCLFLDLQILVFNLLNYAYMYVLAHIAELNGWLGLRLVWYGVLLKFNLCVILLSRLIERSFLVGISVWSTVIVWIFVNFMSVLRKKCIGFPEFYTETKFMVWIQLYYNGLYS